MPKVLETVLYYALTTLPYYAAAYIPFVNKLRFSKGKTACILSAAGALACFAVAAMYLLGIKYRLIEFTLVSLFVLLFFTLVKQNIFKLLFFAVFTADTVIVIRGISLFLCYNIFGLEENMYIPVGIVHILAFVIIFPAMYMIIKKDIDIILEVEGIKLWSTLWLLPFITAIIVFIYTYDISAVGVQKWQFISSRLLFGVSTLFIYTVILKSLKQMREQTILKERADGAAHIIQIYTERYDLLKAHIEEVKKARHNLRQHNNLIVACIEKDDISALKEYISKYTKTLPKEIRGGYSANYAVDTIVGWYGEQAEEKNIKFDVDIKIPSKINISEPELCVVLGNLIENAVNACEKVTKTAPFIKIRGASPTDGTVIFTVENSCEDLPEDFTFSEETGGSGLGLRSVYDIAQKYKGIADFKCRGNVFYASVMLNSIN
ncbi:MAG: GHKL domain-containing protein [Eubacterium sp.]|nr:GHKL domain-containing protein [Eubacterium sp.]